ncbi:MAG: hypothetical protein V1646_01340 [bacterium]
MKKSLLIVSAFFLITSVSTENAFGMEKKEEESKKRYTLDSTTAPSAQPKKRQKLEEETSTVDAHQETGTNFALIGQLARQMQATQTPEDAALLAAAPAVEQDSSSTPKPEKMEIEKTASESELTDSLRQALTPILGEKFRVIELQLEDLCQGQIGIKASQKRLESGQTRVEAAIERVSTNQAAASQQLTRLEDATQQNNVLIVAVRGNVTEINRQVADLTQRTTEIGRQLTQLDGRVITEFERSATDHQDLRRHIDQLVRVTRGAPITLLLFVAAATGVPLYMLQGIVTAGIGTTVMVLATNQAYPICLQIAQNPAVQFILRHINIRRAHAIPAAPVERADVAVGAPAPAVPVPAVEALDARARDAAQAQQRPAAPAEQHHCAIM